MKRKTKSKLSAGGKLSKTLSDFIAAMPKNQTTIGELMAALEGRSYGLMLLLLALPNVIPIPTPGLSAIVGAPLVLLTFQLVIGIKTPWLPNFIERKKISRKSLEKSYLVAERYLKMLEKVMQHRLEFFARPPASRLVALVCFLMSLLILLPVPFSNAFPAFAVCLLAMAILMRDGLFVIFGIVAAVASVILIYLLFDGALDSLDFLFKLGKGA